MAGISSNALKGVNYPENRRKYNGNELQSKEFGDGTGLEWTDFNARTYDQQIGRFQQIDPLLEDGQENLTPYHFAYNNPVRYSDPDGKFPIFLAWGLPAIGEAIVYLGAATGITAAAVKVYNQVIDPALKSGAVGSIDHMPNFVVQRPSTVKSEEAKAPPSNEKSSPSSNNKSKAQERADKLSQKQRPGQDFTKAGKEATKDVNKEKNGGQMKCENCDTDVQPGKKHQRGETPPSNEAHVDHVVPKSKGGSGTPDNGQILCRGCNLEKSNH
jgi:RHS repeat-associated core domain